MIKTIFFDLHGVLDKHTFASMLEIIAKNSFKTGDYDNYRLSFFEKYAVLANAYAAGDILPEHFWSKLLQDGLEIEVLSEARDYILDFEVNESILNQAQKLKEKFKLGIFSDCPSDKYEVIINNTDFTNIFDYTLFSSQIGFGKSDPEFYREMISRTGLKPSEIFYVDENLNNAAAAKKLGINAIGYSEELNLVKHFNLKS